MFGSSNGGNPFSFGSFAPQNNQPNTTNTIGGNPGFFGNNVQAPMFGNAGERPQFGLTANQQTTNNLFGTGQTQIRNTGNMLRPNIIANNMNNPIHPLSQGRRVIPQNNQSQVSRLNQDFKMAFFHIFQKQTSCKQLEKYDDDYPLMEGVRRFLENRQKNKARFFTSLNLDQIQQSDSEQSNQEEYQIDIISQLINKIDQENIQFFPCYLYGGMVIMEQLRKHYTPDVYLSFPTQWREYAFVNTLKKQKNSLQKRQYETSNVTDFAFIFDHIYIGKIEENHDNIEDSMEALIKKLKNQLEKYKSNSIQNKNLNPTSLAMILTQVSQPHGFQKRNQIKFVNSESKPATPLQLAWSFINFVAENNNLTQCLMMNYRAELLWEKISNFKNKMVGNVQAFYTEFSSYSKCLQEVRGDCQRLLSSKNSYFNHKKAFNLIVQMGRLLKQAYPDPHFQTKTYQQMGLSLIIETVPMGIIKPLILKLTDKKQTLPANPAIQISCDGIFQSFIMMQKIWTQKQWIIAFEDTIFSMCANQLIQQRPFVNFPEDILVSSSKSLLLSNLETYCQFMQNHMFDENFVFLSAQKISHKQLMKALIGTMGFEIYKHRTSQTIYSIDSYRVPFHCKQIFENFNSMNYKARRAVKSLVFYYQKHEKNTPLFDHEKGYQNFKIYGAQVGAQNQKIIIEVQRQKREEEEIDNKLTIMIKDFHKQTSSMQKNIKNLQNQPCRCERKKKKELKVQEKKFRAFNYNQDDEEEIIICERCIEIQKRKIQLSNHLQKRQDIELFTFPKTDRQIHLFYLGMKNDCKQLMKLLMFSQNNRQSGSHSLQDSILFDDGVSISRASANSGIFMLKNTNQNDLQVLKRFESTSLTILNNESWFSEIYFRPMNEINSISSIKKLDKYPQDFLCNPENLLGINMKKREHQIYQKINKRPINVNPQQYIGIGSIRVEKHTQLLLVLEKLLNRSIKLFVDGINKSHQYEMMILWKSVAELQTELDLNFYNSEFPQNLQDSMRLHIEDFLDNFMDSWSADDFKVMPIVGPIICLLFEIQAYSSIFKLQPTFIIEQTGVYQKQSVDDLFHIILKKTLTEFKSLQDDTDNQITYNENIKKQNYTNQGYLCVGALCYFLQPIITSEDVIAEQFEKLIILFKTKQIFFDQKSTIYKQIEMFSYLKNRAILNNINAVKDYFIGNPNLLTDIVSLADEGIDPYTEWDYRGNESNYYIFNGFSSQFSTTYELDIKSGMLLVNGLSLKRLNNNFKENEYFKGIFGSCDFEVYPNEDNTAQRVRRSFKQAFTGNIDPKTQNAFFQFGYSRNAGFDKITISIIFRLNSSDEEEKWELVTEKEHIDRMNIPVLYTRFYYPWICRRRKCIAFRKKNITEICEVGLVVFYDNDKVEKAHFISKHHQKAHINQICQPFSQMFDEVILRNDSEKISSAFQILGKLDLPQYIIELHDMKKDIRKYWLHRYNLMCFQQKDKGLSFDICKDYRVASTPYSCDYLPWSSRDRIAGIILQKYEVNELTQNFHRIKVLLPFEQFYIHNPDRMDPNKATLSCFLYDLHDHLHRLSGINRLQQLHLVAIMTYIGSDIPIPKLSITPLEYAVMIMHTCFNNSPLTKQQFSIIKYIQRRATKKNQTIILFCHALLIMTSELVQLNKFPFSIRYYELKGYLQRDDYIEFINRNMNIYNWKTRDRIINQRNKIPQHICAIIGLKFNFDICYGQNGRDMWEKQLPLKVNLNHVQYFLDELEQCLIETKQFKIRMTSIEQEIYEEDYEKDCPIQVKQDEENTNILIKEVIEELKLSYKSYLEDKKEIDKIVLTHNMVDEFEKHLELLCQKKDEIETILEYAEKANENHPDLVIRSRPNISRLDYVAILTDKAMINAYYPEISQQSAENLFQLIRYWMIFTVQVDSFKRIILHLNTSKKIDKTILLRQLESPRELIQNKIYWVCFQVEMKIQIWISQYETYDHLMNCQDDKNGLISQLNMGEGKTQVIIPMISLELLYGNSKYGKKIPRVNLLTSIFNESKTNFYRFFSTSGFNIPIIQLPFDRSTNLNQIKILKQIVRSLAYHREKMLVLLDQSSVHSLILKLKEISIKSQGEKGGSKQKIIFEQFQCFDIFDEVDAQMTPKKSFIYSMGGQSILDELDFRSKVPGIIIDAICSLSKEMIDQGFLLSDETESAVDEALCKGQYPKGLRLISGVFSDNNEKRNIFKWRILSSILDNPELDEFQSFLKLKEQDKNALISYLLNDNIAISHNLKKNLSEGLLKRLYSIRGYIANGICEHCLSLRCRVNYGVPDNQRVQNTEKRIAVPYQAADIPSKRNDFAHPDVAIFLSYLAYYDAGLSYENFENGMDRLFSITKGNIDALNEVYASWHRTLSEQAQQKLGVQNGSQIKLDSNSQMLKLYQAFKMNRKFIGFWLINCILPDDMQQYLESITSSSWDHACVPESLGFSGTKDLNRLFPTYLEYQESINKRIRGTDGKMLEMLLENTLEIVNVEQDDQPLWKRIIQTFLNLNKQYQIASFIDVGAALAGNSLKEEIVPFLAAHQNFNRQNQFKGISFCANNQWNVYQISNNEYVQRGTTVLDHETFVIFDEYRTRGADMKMSSNISAVLTLSPTLTKDSLMQAVGRLRKIGRDQKIVIMMTNQVKQKINKYIKFEEDLETKEKVKIILNWTCMNSVKENEKYLLENSKLAKIHLKNKYTSQKFPSTQKAFTDLQSMYAEKIQHKSVHNISSELFKQIEANNHKIKILENTYKYGDKTIIRIQKFEEVLERQVEAILQVQKKNQLSEQTTKALPQSDDFKPIRIKMSEIAVHFTPRLKYSKNFHQCTTNTSEHFTQKGNQLCKSHFVLLDTHEICMISIREANKMLIQSSYELYVPDSKRKYNPGVQKYVAMLHTLTIYERFISENKLEDALIQCKIFNGCRRFDEHQQSYVKKFFAKSQITMEYISYFLRKRKMIIYYKNSVLEKVFRTLALLNKEQIQELLRSDYQLTNI